MATQRITLHREEGHPGGWSSDYGMFSDITLWTVKRYPGWYGNIPIQIIDEVKNWCEQYLQYNWDIRYNELFIQDQRDLTIFMLRWS